MRNHLLVGLGLLLLGLGVLASLDLPSQRPRLGVALGGPDGLEVLEAPGAGEPPEGAEPGAGAGLRVGDRLLSLDGRALTDGGYLGFVLDGRRVGEVVELELERGGLRARARAELRSSLDLGLLIVNFITGLLLWSLGMLLALKGAGLGNRMFYLASLCLSAVMFLYWPENPMRLPHGERLAWVLTLALGPLAAACLLHFSLVYPEDRRGRLGRNLTPLLYLPALTLGALGIYWLARARAGLAPEDVACYQAVLAHGLSAHQALYVALSLLALGCSFAHAQEQSSRQRLKWLFWGLALGMAPQILGREVPLALGLTPWLPEHATFACIGVAPIAFAISIRRHRLLDVDLVIQRSLVYSLVSAFVVAAYLGLVGLGDFVTQHLWGQTSTGVRVVVVLLLAAAFAPARSLAQRLVDRSLFRQQTDQRAALLGFSRFLAKVPDLQGLRAALAELLQRVMSTERLRVLVADGSGEVLRELQPPEQAGRQEPARVEASSLALLDAGARSGAFTPDVIPTDLRGTEVLVPLRTEGRLVGLLTLGPKSSGLAYTDEERGFVNAVGAQTAVAFDRARALQQLQEVNLHLEQLVFERTQQLAQANDRLAEQCCRLQQLDAMKESLTRMVVHDLKNPVATILLGLEILDRGTLEGVPPHVASTLEIISTTMRDIQDLVANLLDVHRMEAGELTLEAGPVGLAELLSECARRVEVIARYRQVRVVIQAEAQGELRADRALLVRLLVNLLTNAVKYATRASEVELVAAPGPDGGAWLSVTNRGTVIPPELHGRIFEKFFQVDGRSSGPFASTGLGLTFCKLVAEAHGGRIQVESPPAGRGDGARFALWLPGLSAAAGPPGGGGA
ncbi:MAG TPA: ATP-binding protein [Myxococcota bacterium]|nr:ATP-binding protein [Myxococcota bacterium]HRY95283.1 ATP-binding protein [Myxococcota bacterium]HSA22343.1 ATP-binding protein [Myxococcota bacterium]